MKALDTLLFGQEEVDLSAVEQLFDSSQTRGIGEALLLLMAWIAKPQWRGKSLSVILTALDKEIDSKVTPSLPSRDLRQAPFIPIYAQFTAYLRCKFNLTNSSC